MTVYRINVELPEGALVTESVASVGYLLPDGTRGTATHTNGGAPMTTYLGLLDVAHDDVLRWGRGDRHHEA